MEGQFPSNFAAQGKHVRSPLWFTPGTHSLFTIGCATERQKEKAPRKESQPWQSPPNKRTVRLIRKACPSPCRQCQAKGSLPFNLHSYPLFHSPFPSRRTHSHPYRPCRLDNHRDRRPSRSLRLLPHHPTPTKSPSLARRASSCRSAPSRSRMRCSRAR